MTSVYRRLKAAVPVVVLVAVFGAGIASRTSIVSWWSGITTPDAARAVAGRRARVGHRKGRTNCACGNCQEAERKDRAGAAIDRA